MRNIRYFYLSYPKRDALRHELSWTHYRILMRVEKPQARSFYEIECVKNNWSARELERQKGSLLFERLALSKDKKGQNKSELILYQTEDGKTRLEVRLQDEQATCNEYLQVQKEGSRGPGRGRWRSRWQKQQNLCKL